MTDSILYIAGGLAALAIGGELLVRGASALAIRLRLTHAVIGLTVIAIGTSLPELVVSVAAQLRGSPDMSIGNVVGSNIFNIGLVLGACSLIRPLVIPGSTVRLEWPFMFIAALLLYLLARDLEIDRVEAAFFLISFVLFTAYMVRLARREVGRAESASLEQAVEGVAGSKVLRRSLAFCLALVLLGSGALWLGAEWLIEGARGIASRFGVSERVIGLSMVAAGTGLPELVATLVAVLHRRTDMAVGNIVGSNICNILLVLAAAAMVRPLEVNPLIIEWDIWWLLGISFILGPFLLGNRLDRREGFIILAGYGVYAALLFR
ncbi:MAG: calcium/sodium antiporter [Planctomycetes bacterium]|nr:calcium/sodium antiporter [Planctomycetota bacterium]